MTALRIVLAVEVLITISLLHCVPAHAAEPTVAPSEANYDKATPEQITDLLIDRDRLVYRLIEALKEHQRVNSPKAEDMMRRSMITGALGYLRAPEAIDVLIADIDFEYVTNPVGINNPPSAAHALAHIGTPCVPRLMEILAKPPAPGKETRDIALNILEQVLTPAMARRRVELELQNTSDAAKRKNLEQALQECLQREKNELASPLRERRLELDQWLRYPLEDQTPGGPRQTPTRPRPSKRGGGGGRVSPAEGKRE